MQQESVAKHVDLFFTYQENQYKITLQQTLSTTIEDVIQIMMIKLLEFDILIEERWVDCIHMEVLLSKQKLTSELNLQDQVLELWDYHAIKQRNNQKYSIYPEVIKKINGLTQNGYPNRLSKIIKKCLTEIAELNSQAKSYFKAYPEADNSACLKIFIIGPRRSLYENGIYQLYLDFGKDYPFKPPKIQFITKIKHPNINNGMISLSMLQDEWTPALYRIETVMISVISLLSDPNLQTSLDLTCVKQYQKDYDVYIQIVEDYIKKYASPTVQSMIEDVLGQKEFNQEDYDYLKQQFTEWIQYWKNF